MTSLCSKIVSEKEDRLWFAGMIVIAANGGGAWSPLGDVTTTMLWIGGQITAMNILTQLILPSLIACIIPALTVAYRFKGKKVAAMPESVGTPNQKRNGEIVLFAGGFLIFVPAFKTLTRCPVHGYVTWMDSAEKLNSFQLAKIDMIYAKMLLFEQSPESGSQSDILLNYSSAAVMDSAKTV